MSKGKVGIYAIAKTVKTWFVVSYENDNTEVSVTGIYAYSEHPGKTFRYVKKAQSNSSIGSAHAAFGEARVVPRSDGIEIVVLECLFIF